MTAELDKSLGWITADSLAGVAVAPVSHVETMAPALARRLLKVALTRVVATVSSWKKKRESCQYCYRESVKECFTPFCLNVTTLSTSQCENSIVERHTTNNVVALHLSMIHSFTKIHFFRISKCPNPLALAVLLLLALAILGDVVQRQASRVFVSERFMATVVCLMWAIAWLKKTVQLRK